ncbi:hypothetical protein RJ640_017897 [Escallonia rubra]|uniref:GCF C-terminal domain-containing protein n=1 Tax=Escallonia rubra TaxID=112253 RepID=A0AA88QR47_9ASTE|nr:hypothetical protein RJ640_017897 [Escallonia rubra]
MSSRGRNFRRRADDDDDEDENKDSTTTAAKNSPTTTKKPHPKPTTITTATRKPTTITTATRKPTTQPPKKLLSFADDEDSETPFSRPIPKQSQFPIHRPSKTPTSSSSHKLTLARDRANSSSSPSIPSNVQPQAGTYTKEALLELQKNTRTLATSSARPVRPSEPVVILKGLLKPESKPDPDRRTAREAHESEKEIDPDSASAQLGSLGLGLGESIPDQATINAIRAKRERLRQSRAAAPDYIAIDGGSNHGAAEGLSDEEPEFRGRIALVGENADGGRKKQGVFEDVDQRVVDKSEGQDGSDGDIDEDDEDKIWEEEQVRKGLGKRMDEGGNKVVSASVTVVQGVQQQQYMYPSATATYPSMQSSVSGFSIGGAAGSWLGLDAISISQQAEVAKKAIHESVRRLKVEVTVIIRVKPTRETHGRTTASLTRTEENLSASLLNASALESSLAVAGEKFIFMQKLRDFVSVMCDFLQDKAFLIEELESQMQKLNKERAVAIVDRRAADNDDEMLEIEAAVSAAMLVYSKSGSNTSVEAAKSAAHAAFAATRKSRNLPVELDEFGRDVNRQQRMDMTRRAEARQRRKARSDSRRMSSMQTDGTQQRIEGESSTDESDSESTAYKSNRDRLLQFAEKSFSDAADEYSQLSMVKEKLERWKKDYFSSYNDAYMSLSVPEIFSPYVRLELLKWDPLHEDSDFINMKWHSLLFTYGLPEDESTISQEDADANLVPALVEKVAIPILHHEIAHCWDTLSTRQTKFAVSATHLVFSYVPLSSKALGELVAVLRDRLADAVANLMVPTWNTLVMNAVPDAARVAACRFGMSVRLMKNICLWNKILSMPVLEKLALDELLSGKIIPHLRSIQANIHDAVTRAERIIASVSGVWSGPGVTRERSPKMQPLVDYLLILGKILEKKHVSGATGTGDCGLARRLKKMLVELNEYDHARAISRTFNLKEAL